MILFGFLLTAAAIGAFAWFVGWHQGFEDGFREGLETWADEADNREGEQ